ncbi:hypothetical protein ACTQ33_09535 [Candidatus Avoscillospira sp. LCP25S3_F1]|uniref:hypothetical protein n=1 Tax=Candidatus Avoscillospira sp. LCP25S3_F1 TaxID=3438825 RepID=UPI003F93CB54
MNIRKLPLLMAALLACTIPAAACQVPNQDPQAGPLFDQMNTDPQDQADFLHALGLFRGTAEGYALDRSMTRSEAAVMLVRLLGKEDEALAQSPSHPFTDVPQWASPYVGWLWTNGLARGVSATAYGADHVVTAEQYLIFLTRALYGPNVPDDAWYTGWAVSLRPLQQSLDQTGFLRRDAVTFSVLALNNTTSSNQTLASRLIQDNVFTAEQFQTPSLSIFHSVYTMAEGNAVCRTTAGVTYTSSETGLEFLYGSGDAPHDHLLATRQTAGQTELCPMDCDTLALVGQPVPLPLTDGQTVAYGAGTADSGDYLLLRRADGVPERLLYFDGQTVQSVLELEPLWSTLESPFYVFAPTDGGVLLTIQDHAGATSRSWLLEGAAVTALSFLDDQKPFDVLPESVLVQQTVGEETVLQQIAMPSGTVLARFELPHAEDSPFPDPVTGGKQLLERTVFDETEGFYWGGAGLYRVENGVLQCLLDRPVDDLLVLDDGSLYVLTHTLGYPATLGASVVMERHPGNEILYRSPVGVWETALSADTGHDITITHLWDADEAGLVGFSWTEWDTRPGDSVRYVLLRQGQQPSIRVESLNQAYPETQVPAEQIPVYLEQLRQAEQQRLNDLGLGIAETP